MTIGSCDLLFILIMWPRPFETSSSSHAPLVRGDAKYLLPFWSNLSLVDLRKGTFTVLFVGDHFKKRFLFATLVLISLSCQRNGREIFANNVAIFKYHWSISGYVPFNFLKDLFLVNSMANFTLGYDVPLTYFRARLNRCWGSCALVGSKVVVCRLHLTAVFVR